MAVLPNLQIDGVLNIENGGEVFIPSGATFSDLDSQLALKAPLVSPAFINPTATTQTAQDNSTKVATTAYVDSKMVLGTAVNSTSGTSIDFTGIPSWVKRITVMFEGVSTNGGSPVQIQLGDSGGIENSGYFSASTNSTVTSNYTSGFGIYAAQAQNIRNGIMDILKINNNNFVQSHNIGLSDTTIAISGGGSKTLSATLDRIRITTVNGTDTFDAGQINIMYEG